MIPSLYLAQGVGGTKKFLNAVLECNLQTCIKSARLFLTSHGALILVYHYVLWDEISRVGDHSYSIREGILKMKGLLLQIWK